MPDLDASNVMRQWWVVPGVCGGELECRTAPIPDPGAGEVLVSVAAAGVNRGEVIGRASLRSDNPQAAPRPSGIEFAGVVERVGEGVDRWSVGDRVMGRGSACHADYTRAGAQACMPSPSHLSDTQAGAIPNVFVTAHNALVTAAQLRAGESVLISAGSSGVGTAALQIARHLGAERIIATTRTNRKRDALAKLGATQVINTTDPDWPLGLSAENGVDVVIDQVGGDLFPDLLRTLRVSGRYVSVGRNAGANTTLDLDWLALKRLSLIGVTFRTRTPSEALACTQRFADALLSAFSPDESASQSGPSLGPLVDRTFGFAELPQAHEYMMGNQQIGKILLVK